MALVSVGFLAGDADPVIGIDIFFFIFLSSVIHRERRAAYGRPVRDCRVGNVLQGQRDAWLLFRWPRGLTCMEVDSEVVDLIL